MLYVVATLLKPSDFTVNSGRGAAGVTLEGVAFAPTVGLTVGGRRNVAVRASLDGGHAIEMSATVCVIAGVPGAELPDSSGIDTGVDGMLLRPRGLTATAK